LKKFAKAKGKAKIPSENTSGGVVILNREGSQSEGGKAHDNAISK